MESDDRRRVLLVDPDERFGALFSSYLRREGWKPTWLADGREALANWSELSPDLVVTALQGESLDAFEFLERLRSFSSSIPIVVCTRQAGVQNWSDEVFGALGVQAVLVRPVRFVHAEWTLQQVLSELR